MSALDFAWWEPRYRAIVEEFGFDPNADEAAARALGLALARPPFACEPAWRRLELLLGATTVVVLGAADDAARALAKEDAVHPLVAADGATTAALEAGRRPDLVVTDLDGRVEDEVLAARQGAIIAIHAHGDNRDAVKEWLPRFEPSNVVGTCQTRPVAPLRNAGGFTDGDRAAFLAADLGATRLRLVGFDFTGRPGRYTGTFNPKTKPQKLRWARRLLSELADHGTPIEFA